MAKKLNALQREYRKQRRRLQSAKYRAEKQGFIFDDSIIPAIPKKITEASVRRLQKLTPEDIRKKGRYIIHETGEIIPVKNNKKLIKEDKKWIKEQEKEARKVIQDTNFGAQEPYPRFSEVVIRNFKSYILGFPPSISEMIMGLINTIINEVGEDELSIALQNMPMQFHEYLQQSRYDSGDGVSNFSSSLIEHLPNTTLNYKKELMERFEYNEIGYIIEDEET